MKLSEFVDINPRTSLPKGTEAEFVPMEALSPQRRYVRTYPKKKYSGGAKFINGDTLFARITPCLENGKISQFVSDSNLPAFGSTEYWILRAKEGISDPSYVYYLAKSEVLRRPAEKSMVGASGRQRAQIESIQDLDVGNVSLGEQRTIAGVLSAYDDLIENNSKRIEKLEAMARILYRHTIETEDVEEVKMGDVANIKWGDTSKTKKSYVPEDNAYIAYSASGPDGFLPYFDYNQTGIVLSAIGANCGKTWLARGKWSCIKNTIRYFTKSDVVSNEFLYLATEGDGVWPTRGSAQPFISQGDVIASRVKILSDEGKMRELSKELSKYFELIDILSKRNHKLTQARDMLLPRLMSGEIKV